MGKKKKLTHLPFSIIQSISLRIAQEKLPHFYFSFLVVPFMKYRMKKKSSFLKLQGDCRKIHSAVTFIRIIVTKMSLTNGEIQEFSPYRF